MNDHEIETLLRKAPQPKPPGSLRKRLYADIEVSTDVVRDARGQHRPSWLRRWLPALGFAVWFITCVVVLGVQGARIAELKERHLENEAALEQQKEAAAAASAARQAAMEATAAARAEAEKLRAEVAELHAMVAELEKVKAENAKIRASMAAQRSAMASTAATPEQDFFTVQKERAERTACINNIKQVGLAARIWANDSKTDALPTDFEAIKPKLNGGERRLVCPSDGNTRYALVSPGASESRPDVVFVRCPIHNNVGLVDGSAQMLNPNIRLIQRDGAWVIER